MDKASELYLALKGLKNREIVNRDSSSPPPMPMSSQPLNDVLQQSLLMTAPMDEPRQEPKQAQDGLGLEHDEAPSSQHSQHESEQTGTTSCAIADDEFLAEGQEQQKKEKMTETLLRCGGDIRPLLVNQPLSRYLSTSSDKKGNASGKITAGKQQEEEEQEQEQERFVRPHRLRHTVSKEAASDGFPCPIALTFQWHPDHMMQDIPEIALSNLSIRAAFDTKFEEHYVFRHWRLSQGRLPVSPPLPPPESLLCSYPFNY